MSGRNQGLRWATTWKVPGVGIFVCFAVLTAFVLFALLRDATTVAGIDALLVELSVRQYAYNSIVVGVPTAILCTLAASLLAYRLRFLVGRQALLPLLILLAPFLSSPVAIYVGLKEMLGAGPWTLAAGLLLRYFPIAVIVMTITLESLPDSLRQTFANLGISDAKAFRRVVFPVLLPNMLLVTLLLCLIMPLDVLGSTIGGGGLLQTFGNLISDYSRTRDIPGIASLLTAVFVTLGSCLVLLVVAITSRGSKGVDVQSARRVDWGTSRLRQVLTRPLFAIYMLAYGAVLVTLLSQQRGAQSDYGELKDALYATLWLVLPVAVIAGATALLVAIWIHLSRSGLTAFRGRLIAAALIIPALLPPVLSARMASVVQGVVGVHSTSLTLAFWYLYFLGCIPALVVLSHPVVLDGRLPLVARNLQVKPADYIVQVLLPSVVSVVLIGMGLFVALASSDAVIARYVGGSTKTVGLVLANHQEGTLSRSDYAFLGGVGLCTLVLLILLGAAIDSSRRTSGGGPSSFPAGSRSPTSR